MVLFKKEKLDFMVVYVSKMVLVKESELLENRRKGLMNGEEVWDFVRKKCVEVFCV